VARHRLVCGGWEKKGVLAKERVNLLHVFVIFELFFFCGCILVLLVFRDQVVHVGFSFGELHLVHTFTGVPVQEGLTPEHRSELLSHTFEHVLDGGGVSDEGGGHLESLGWDVAHGGLDVVGDPFNEVRGVLVLDVQHLLVNFLGGHSSSEHGGGGQVSSVSRVGGAHHVLGVEHLLGQFWDGQGSVLLGSSGGQRSESSHEEVETRERNQVDGQLSEVGVQLTRESEAASDTGHGGGNQVVQVTVGGGGELQGSEADVIKSFVVNDHDFISVFDQLVDGKGGVVRLNDGVGDLWRWEDGEGAHHSVGVFLADFGDEKSSHSGSSSSSEGVGDLESLKTVASFGFLADDVKDGVNQLSTFGVMSFCPVVSGSGLSEDEVVWSEKLSEWSSTDGVHGTRFKVHEDRTWDIASTSCFVEVNVDALQLEVGISVVGSRWVNAMFVSNDFPEFGANLVSALSGLDMNDFSHGDLNSVKVR